MQSVLFLRRPRLPTWMIRSTSREILPHELHHFLTLLNSRERQRLLRPHCLNLLPRELAIRIEVSTSHDQNVSKLDLCALIFGYLTQRLSTDRARLKSAVLHIVLQSPGMIIQQNPTADDALLCPCPDSIHIALGRPVDVVERHAIVEPSFFLISKMSQTVPLTARLCIEGPDVVVDDSWWLLVDVLLEGLASEEGYIGLSVEGPIEVDSRTGLDLAGGRLDDVVGQAIEGAELVVFAIQAPRVVMRAVLVEGKGGELRDARRHGGRIP